ncbi:hypothetical protein KGQ55_02835 [Patescibacteria group bacterium]|nr:hypothetical protein [Patescibacteria group bacterium]
MHRTEEEGSMPDARERLAPPGSEWTRASLARNLCTLAIATVIALGAVAVLSLFAHG